MHCTQPRFRRQAPRIAAVLAALALCAATARAQTMQFFGDWVVAGSRTIVVRRDHPFDNDFDARVSGTLPDLGADEVTELFGPAPTSFTRAATITPTQGSSTGSDTDADGNLSPTPGGLWASEVLVTGIPNDLVVLFSGVGFNDFITDPAFPGFLLENSADFQNVLLSSLILPGMTTTSSFCLDLGGGSVNVGITLIPPGGTIAMPTSFGAFNPAFREAEAHLQAVAFDPATLTLVQTTNRLSIELNE